MAKIQIPCLVARTNQAGVTSWYWQPSKTLAAAGWKPLALGKDEGAAIAAARARNDEVTRWKAGGEIAPGVRRRGQAGTLAALIARYRADVLEARRPDGRWLIARSTAKTYGTGLLRLEAWAGKQPLAFITRARVKVLKAAMLAPAGNGGVGHYAAHAALKMGRVLFRFAEDCDLVPPGANPFARFGLAAPDPRDVIWSAPARELIVETADARAAPSIALAVLLGFGIGQREQDILALTVPKYVAIPEHKMQPEDFATLAALAPDGVPRGIRVRQLKTRAWIEVPVVGETRRRLEASVARARAAGQLLILQDDSRAGIYGGDAGQTRFQRDFAEIREHAALAAAARHDHELAAEIRTLQFRDLRRTCVVYLGELGMDAHLIAGVTGHDIDETQRILRTYMPRTTGRAARAIALASAREPKPIDQARPESERPVR